MLTTKLNGEINGGDTRCTEAIHDSLKFKRLEGIKTEEPLEEHEMKIADLSDMPPLQVDKEEIIDLADMPLLNVMKKK